MGLGVSFDSLSLDCGKKKSAALKISEALATFVSRVLGFNIYYAPSTMGLTASTRTASKGIALDPQRVPYPLDPQLVPHEFTKSSPHSMLLPEPL